MFEDDLSESDLFGEVYTSSAYSLSSEDEDSNIQLSTSVAEPPNEHISAIASTTIQKSRKRVRNENSWVRNIRKQRRNSGKSYVTRKGNIVQGKKMNIRDCSCIAKCHQLIPKVQCEKLFTNYYELGNHDLQTAFVNSLVKVVSKQRVYAKENINKRQNTRLYFLTKDDGTEVKVCKEFFKSVFAISDGRLTRALINKTKGISPPIDGRSLRKVPINKTNDEKVNQVTEFIAKIPAYNSHYSRKKNINRKYISPSLNISILYNLYKEENNQPVSLFVFRKIFNTCFNYSFHAPVSDSCRRCDSYKIKLNSVITPEQKKEIETLKELHLRKAESARAGMANDAEEGKIPGSDVTVIAFDLMKTLPTPVLTTGITYYKRQLWTYCLSIHNLCTDEVFMYIWNEAVASRGPEEIGSCVLNYIKNHVVTSKIIMYSDQCGGQNRNIKMASLCNYIVTSSQYAPKVIDHKFLVSGHSYLACDQDFGLIEKQKKYHPHIYVPDDWLEVISAARKKRPFFIKTMNITDFFTFRQLQQNITNRKLTNEKQKVEWLKIQWLRYESLKPFILHFKYSNDCSVLFSEVNVKKRVTEPNPERLEILYPNGRKIDEAKKKDLMCLLDFIPPVKHEFYKNIFSSANVVDDGLLTGEESEDDEH